MSRSTRTALVVCFTFLFGIAGAWQAAQAAPPRRGQSSRLPTAKIFAGRQGPSNIVARPQTARPALPGPGGFAPKLPDLVITNQSISNVVREGAKYKVTMVLTVRNQGAADASYFKLGVFYAQPIGAGHLPPPLAKFTHLTIFKLANGQSPVVQKLEAGKSVMVVGHAYLPVTPSLNDKNVHIRAKADVGGSIEHAQPWGSVKEIKEDNNWSKDMKTFLKS